MEKWNTFTLEWQEIIRQSIQKQTCNELTQLQRFGNEISVQMQGTRDDQQWTNRV